MFLFYIFNNKLFFVFICSNKNTTIISHWLGDLADSF